jgi:hypothetical protein
MTKITTFEEYDEFMKQISDDFEVSYTKVIDKVI